MVKLALASGGDEAYRHFATSLELVMDGVDLSDQPGMAIAARVAEIAEREGRSPDQIAAAALRVYVSLPEAARNELRRIEAEGETQLAEAAWAVGRALIDRQYDALIEARRLRGGLPLPLDASEQDILDYAVKICRRR